MISILAFTPCVFGHSVSEKARDTDGLEYRGVVYDVGLWYEPGVWSVETFDPARVRYDMRVIADTLHANTVRIEGENISRLVAATEIAHEAGLKVFFNPWKMDAEAHEVVSYMREAATAAEQLRGRGIDLVFVTGCEYSLFDRGVFEGETLNERMASMIEEAVATEGKSLSLAAERLNAILGDICKAVREEFGGLVTYASGTWEDVDWDLYDIVGVDHYRAAESDEEYVEGLKEYYSSKPLVVMEVGCCAYEGAAAKGGAGFSIVQGTNPDGTIAYVGGETPVRSETEQADYVETQIELISRTDAKGVFIFVFAFPVWPDGGEGRDYDMTSYALVKSFPAGDPRTRKMPGWEAKEAYLRLAKIYGEMAWTKR
jgi:hypothetical protein